MAFTYSLAVQYDLVSSLTPSHVRYSHYHKIQINFAKNRFDELGPCREVSLPAETNYADDNEIADIEFTSISSVC